MSGAEYVDEVSGYCDEQVQTDFGGPLHRLQAHSIRSMITRGLMPPAGKLSRESGLGMERWLNGE